MEKSDYDRIMVYDAFSAAVTAFLICARTSVKHSEMDMEQSIMYGRAMADLKLVAEAPCKYFSREKTLNDWQKRAGYHAYKSGPDAGMAEAFLKQSPAMIIAQKSRDLGVSCQLYNDFYNLCAAFLHWEYARVSDNENSKRAVLHNRAKVIEYQKKFQDLASNNLKKYAQEFADCVRRAGNPCVK